MKKLATVLVTPGPAWARAQRYVAVKSLTALCALAIGCAAVQARTITDNDGGYIADFISALDDMRTRKELLEILGQCASACTLIALRFIPTGGTFRYLQQVITVS